MTALEFGEDGIASTCGSSLLWIAHDEIMTQVRIAASEFPLRRDMKFNLG